MLRSLKSIRGFKLAASDGEIGNVREIYFDDYSWTVRYILVRTGGWLTGREVLIPPHALGSIDEEDEILTVHLTKEQIRNSPPLDSDLPSRRYEEAYHRYYGWEPYWASAAGPASLSIPAQPGEVNPKGGKSTELSTSNRREERAGIPHDDLLEESFLRSSSDVLNFTIHAKDGHLGHLEDFVIDDEEWYIRYLVIDTLNWFPGDFVLAPTEWINRFSFLEQELFVNVTKDTIRDAPEYDPDLPVERAVERRLYELSGYHAYWEPLHAARLGR